MNFPHLATRLFNTPVMILPEKAEIIMAALAERIGVTHLFRQDGRAVALDGGWMEDDGDRAPDRAYDVVQGVALIPIQGTLVQKSGMLRPWSGMTGYDGIRVNLLTALADRDVEAIALDIDSPGGEVAGCFDLVDTIFRARAKKPIHAILNECACSAAYAIASAAAHVTIPRTGVAGSIGVVWLHADISKALAGAGIAVTLLHYGAHKTDGTEMLPLAKAAAARIQADIDTTGELFVATVARNRGIDPADVRATEAATFLGAAAVRARLVDEVLAPDAALAALVASIT